MLPPEVVWITMGLYVVFMLTVALIEYRMSKKNATIQGFATGSGTIRWPILIMTYIASLMSTWTFFAGPGGYYRAGLGYWLAEMSYICLFPMLMHFVMNKIWVINHTQGANGFVTPTDFYCFRFKSSALRVVLCIIFLCASLPYVGSVLLALGNASTMITGGAVDYRAIVIFLGVLMIVYTAIGGVRSIATTDAIQGVFYISVLLLIVFSCMGFAFGGNWAECISTVWNNTNGWFAYPGPGQWVPYEVRLSYPLQSAIGWTILLPHVFVRSGYMAKNIREQRRVMGIVPILQFLVWTSTMIIGMIGIAVFSNLDTSATEYIIPYMIQNIIGDASPMFAQVLMVLFFIGACAVGVSTADSFLLISGTLVSRDLIEKTFNVHVSEKRNLLITRITVIVVGTIAILVALFTESLIWTLVQFAIAIVVPLFPACVLGIYWKRATKAAALWSSLVGFVIVLLTYFVWGLGDLWYATPALLISLLLMVVISLVTKDDPAESADFYRALEKGEEETYEIMEKKPQGVEPQTA